MTHKTKRQRTLISALALTYTGLCLLSSTPAHAYKNDPNAFKRIMYNGGFHCGYLDHAMFTYPHELTKQVTGMGVDIIKIIADKNNLKFDWAEMATPGNMYSALERRRYDIMCTPSPTPYNAARVATLTDPLFHTTLHAYTTPNRDDIPQALSLLNNNALIIAVKEGSQAEAVAKAKFPRARLMAFPKDGDDSLVLEGIAAGKAHIAIVPPSVLANYNNNETNTIKLEKALPTPIETYSYRLALPVNEHQLKHLIDLTIEEILRTGELDKIMDKYDQEQQLFLRRKFTPK